MISQLSKCILYMRMLIVMSTHILWDSLTLETKLDILLSEALRYKSLAVVTAWLCDKHTLLQAMWQRGIIWDNNKGASLVSQQMFIETAAYDIRRNNKWEQIKKNLLRLL
jgi:hypothetical protein